MKTFLTFLFALQLTPSFALSLTNQEQNSACAAFGCTVPSHLDIADVDLRAGKKTNIWSH
jgi:hypothetical protein